jgi:transcriptional regulator with XRE-family HTH domain
MADFKELREHTGWSQWKLAEATGIERSKISLMECGYVEPSAVELTAIERVLLKEISRLNLRLERVLQSREEIS